ncbi:hypothetical protein BX616_007003, partial [Lobosporangium transversale]
MNPSGLANIGSSSNEQNLDHPSGPNAYSEGAQSPRQSVQHGTDQAVADHDANLQDKVQELNKLMAMIDIQEQVGDRTSEEVVMGPDQDDPVVVLGSYEARLKKLLSIRLLLASRYHNASSTIRGLNIDSNLKSDALMRLKNKRQEIWDSLEADIVPLKEEINCMKHDLALLDGGSRPIASIEPPALSKPRGQEFHVKWNSSDNKEYFLIYQTFKLEYIPLDPKSKDVDYSQINGSKFKDYPVLELDLSRTAREDIMKELARKVRYFLKTFQSFYQRSLPGILFEKMAWIYMSLSLSKVDRATLDYEERIQKFPQSERTWDRVKDCVYRTLEFDKIELDLVNELLEVRLKDGETIPDFAARVLPLIESLDLSDDMCTLLAGRIAYCLSDVGYQAIKSKYKSFRNVGSIKKYLEYLQSVPGAWPGTKTNHSLRIIKRFCGKPTADKMLNLGKMEQVERRSSKIKRGYVHDSKGEEDSSKKQKLTFKPCTYTKRCEEMQKKHDPRQCWYKRMDEKKNGPKSQPNTGNGIFKGRSEGNSFNKTVGAFSRITDE